MPNTLRSQRSKSAVQTTVRDHGVLSIVATPIGNLEDITLRALRILKEADLILAEDTRHTRKLCQYYDIQTPLSSLHEHSSDAKISWIGEQLASAHQHIALVSDAGMPLISDPGFALVNHILAQGLKIEVIPGPSAVLSAVALSGLCRAGFSFFGFLPRSGADRQRALKQIAQSTLPVVLFESPLRAQKTIQALREQLGDDRQVALCRELTKLHEEVVRLPLAQMQAHLSEAPRGELTIVVASSDNAPVVDDAPTETLETWVERELAKGQSVKDVSAAAAKLFNLPRRQVYQLVLTYTQDKAAILQGAKNKRA